MIAGFNVGQYNEFQYNEGLAVFGPSHGKGATLLIESTAGTLVSFSSGLDGIDLNRSLELQDITGLADNDDVYLPEIREGSLSFGGHFASTFAEILDGLHASLSTGTRAWEFTPGSTDLGGAHMLKGQGVLTSLEYGAPVDGKINLSATLTVSGVVTSTVR